MGGAGFEPARFSPGKTGVEGQGGVNRGVSADADPDLDAVVAAWPRLTVEQRRDVRRLAETLAGD